MAQPQVGEQYTIHKIPRQQSVLLRDVLFTGLFNGFIIEIIDVPLGEVKYNFTNSPGIPDSMTHSSWQSLIAAGGLVLYGPAPVNPTPAQQSAQASTPTSSSSLPQVGEVYTFMALPHTGSPYVRRCNGEEIKVDVVDCMSKRVYFTYLNNNFRPFGTSSGFLYTHDWNDLINTGELVLCSSKTSHTAPAPRSPNIGEEYVVNIAAVNNVPTNLQQWVKDQAGLILKVVGRYFSSIGNSYLPWIEFEYLTGPVAGLHAKHSEQNWMLLDSCGALTRLPSSQNKTPTGFNGTKLKVKLSDFVPPSLQQWVKDQAPADPAARKLNEPKNNDGRQSCFWCNAPTKKVPMIFSIADVCTKCGR